MIIYVKIEAENEPIDILSYSIDKFEEGYGTNVPLLDLFAYEVGLAVVEKVRERMRVKDVFGRKIKR